MALAKIDSCIVCDGIRPELNNKTILFGFYGIAPYVTVRLINVNLPANLCFVFSGGATDVGRYNVRLRLLDPAGSEITNDTNSPPIKEGVLGAGQGGTNIFLSFVGVLGKVGRYRVSLMVDGVEHFSTSLGIEQASTSTLAPVVH
jgi:hypothetical protein